MSLNQVFNYKNKDYLTVQHMSRRGKWIDECTYQVDTHSNNSLWDTYSLCKNLIEYYNRKYSESRLHDTPFNAPIRIINQNGEQVLSNRGDIEFIESAREAALISVMLHGAGTNPIFFSWKNKTFMPLNDLKIFIINHGGIKSYKESKTSSEDGNLTWGHLFFNNGEHHTVAFYY